MEVLIAMIVVFVALGWWMIVKVRKIERVQRQSEFERLMAEQRYLREYRHNNGWPKNTRPNVQPEPRHQPLMDALAADDRSSGGNGE